MTAAQQEIGLWKCSSCGHFQLRWQKRYCTACHSGDLAEARARGKASVLSWATYHQNFKQADFRTPYSVGMVRLEEGPALTCLLRGDLGDVSYGAVIDIVASEDVPALATASYPDGQVLGIVPAT
jgi:uncharacterized OB-fold protein